MSEELVIREDITPTLSCSLDEIHALLESIEAAVTAAEIPLTHLREIAGGSQAGLSGELFQRLNYGTGHFRDVRDTIKSLWRAKNTKGRKP